MTTHLDVEIWSDDPDSYENAAAVRSAVPSYGFKTLAAAASYINEQRSTGVEPYQLMISVWDYSNRDEYGAPDLSMQMRGDEFLQTYGAV